MTICFGTSRHGKCLSKKYGESTRHDCMRSCYCDTNNLANSKGTQPQNFRNSQLLHAKTDDGSTHLPILYFFQSSVSFFNSSGDPPAEKRLTDCKPLTAEALALWILACIFPTKNGVSSTEKKKSGKWRSHFLSFLFCFRFFRSEVRPFNLSVRRKSIWKMGLSFSRIFERMFGKKEMRILMVGLDAAGKVRTALPSIFWWLHWYLVATARIWNH